MITSMGYLSFGNVNSWTCTYICNNSIVAHKLKLINSISFNLMTQLILLKYIVDYVKTIYLFYVCRSCRWSSRWRFLGLYRQRFGESDTSGTKVSRLSYLSFWSFISLSRYLFQDQGCPFPLPVFYSFWLWKLYIFYGRRKN